jgi:hypothetical protein
MPTLNRTARNETVAVMVVKRLIGAAARLTVMTQEATALAALMDDR